LRKIIIQETFRLIVIEKAFNSSDDEGIIALMNCNKYKNTIWLGKRQN